MILSNKQILGSYFPGFSIFQSNVHSEYNQYYQYRVIIFKQLIF